jgi:site-specific recombinase XerD
VVSRASLGSVFRKRYRDRHGKLRVTNNWYIEYFQPGRPRPVREATPFHRKADAQQLLRQRMGDADAGKVCLKPGTSFADLETLIVDDYRINGRDSLYELQHCRLPKLREFFGEWKAAAIKTRDVERYKLWRLGLKDEALEHSVAGEPLKVAREAPAQRKGAAPATVNRELSTLRRMFRLAVDQEMLAARPRVVLLREHNVRTGFFEWEEFTSFLGHLPRHFQALFQVAYVTGWRVRSELLTRRWSHIEFNGRGCVRIEPGEAKDATEGREFPFTTWLREVLEEQRRYVRDVERQTGQIIPWVFCRPNGSPIRQIRPTWKKARVKSGINRIPHDFRRTAVRNLERAGVPRAAAMKMVGHKTESIYKRYSIVDHAMLVLGSDRLDKAQKKERLHALKLQRAAASAMAAVH